MAARQARATDTDDVDSIVREAKEAFKLCEEREATNRAEALDDLKFGRLSEQWPDDVVRQRTRDGLPCLTFNHLPAFIRQITNAARQNKPSITVHPADDTADIHTARVIGDLIRQIEVQSQASVAYDTGIDYAASIGFGYWRINTAYCDDDTFDLDIVIEQIANPFSVWGDPYSTGATSKDWNLAFLADLLSKDDFERRYKGAEKVDWLDDGAYSQLDANWLQREQVRVAEYWTREESMRTILMLSDQQVVGEDVYKLRRAEFDQAGLTVSGDRQVKSHKVRQRIVTGAEVLEDRVWPGRYIPIVPVYGEEVNVEGKRIFRSLIRDMKCAQIKFNFDRTKSAELLGLAVVNKFIGPTGAFTDPNWQSANDPSINTLEVDPDAIKAAGGVLPQPIPFDGTAATALLNQAVTSLDDLKAISGIYEPAQGQQGNEVSGVAIGKRIAQSDMANFHFQDNLNRAIEHSGRIIVDLIPYAYTAPRVIRVLGQDGQRQAIPLGQDHPVMGPGGQPQTETAQGINGEPIAKVMTRVYDLSAGKYDVVVDTGPSFTTRRQEAASMMGELAASQPQLAPAILPRLAKMLDWPNAEEIAADLAGQDPRLQALEAKLQAGAQALAQTQAALQQAEAGIADFQVKLDSAKADKDVKVQELRVEGYNAETSRLKALYPKGVPVADPDQLAQVVAQILQGLGTGTDVDPGMSPQPDLSQFAVGLNGQPLHQ